MTALVWNVSNLKFYENGLSKGVLFADDAAGDPTTGVAWEGLISVTESPSGAEVTDLWANNTKYAALVSPEMLGGSIECYTYPPEFAVCDGMVESRPGVILGQQSRRRFSLAYQTRVHDEASGEDVGYLVHLIYNCLVSPAERANATVNDSPEAMTFSYEFTTVPISVTEPGLKALSKLVLDSRTIDAGKLATIEESLFGGTGDSTLLSPDEIFAIIDAA